MSLRDQTRIVNLQRRLHIAGRALNRIKHGCRDPEAVADEAAYEIMKLEMQDRPTPVVVEEKCRN